MQSVTLRPLTKQSGLGFGDLLSPMTSVISNSLPLNSLGLLWCACARKKVSLTGVCITMYVWVDTQVNCENCLESTGLHELFGWLCVVLFEGKSPLQKMPQNDDLSRQETIGQRFPMNCSKIGHSMYEAFTYLFGWNIFIRLLSANKNYPVDLLK